MRRDKILAVLHMMVLLALIFWNYVSNSGMINNKTVGSVSENLRNLFTPAGYAFSIWGIIYLGLIALGIYMLVLAFKSEVKDKTISKALPTLILAHLGNALWLWFWLTEQTGISVIVMVFILLMLTLTALKLNMERWDASTKYIALVWWPIDLYFGWISVATVANISAYLSKLNWNGGLSEVTWTIIMISITSLLGLFMIFNRNMREYAAVFIWAFIAIAVRHSSEIPSITWTAIIGAAVLLIASGIHAQKNRSTLPFIRKSSPQNEM
ncbi:TspO/MBR family protein [Brumimicrobium mesophilum]|uniref:TspO/MBR family protein n=1 Tax=Brumimicrobium mesophilum TaxID=392717 RepID=UPI000D142B90|nr:TspO/MBR family protein [Brumimicrobium mesophilum]